MALTFVIVIILCAAFGLSGYILTGISLYSIAKRRGIEHPWSAWVPLMNFWLIGCISDQYQAIVKGKQKYKRLILLFLILGIVLLYALMVLLLPDASNNMLLFAALFVPLWCAAAVTAVFTFMALYDLYVSCDPKNSVLFLVLSIVIGVTQPFFLFACRNKDLGFPL